MNRVCQLQVHLLWRFAEAQVYRPLYTKSLTISQCCENGTGVRVATFTNEKSRAIL